MEHLMENLTEILNQELEVFNLFLNLLDSQHKQIISGDLKGLGDTNARLDLLSNQAQVLEKRRLEIVYNLTAEMELSDNRSRLSDLIPHLDRVSGNRLQLLRESILSAHKQVEAKSIRNKQLIDKSRDLITESLRIVTTKPSPVYQKPGPVQSTARESNLVNRSV
jgi:flagellar biosynthesis/type III secretory pathway chaperone